MTGAVRRAAWGVGTASAVAAFAGLGVPAVAAAAGVAVLLLAAACWVISSRPRSDHLTRIILGLRGDARCLYGAADLEHDPTSVPAANSPDDQSRDK